jgi:hypothetical protein
MTSVNSRYSDSTQNRPFAPNNVRALPGGPGDHRQAGTLPQQGRYPDSATVGGGGTSASNSPILQQGSAQSLPPVSSAAPTASSGTYSQLQRMSAHAQQTHALSTGNQALVKASSGRAPKQFLSQFRSGTHTPVTTGPIPSTLSAAPPSAPVVLSQPSQSTTTTSVTPVHPPTVTPIRPPARPGATTARGAQCTSRATAATPKFEATSWTSPQTSVQQPMQPPTANPAGPQAGSPAGPLVRFQPPAVSLRSQTPAQANAQSSTPAPPQSQPAAALQPQPQVTATTSVTPIPPPRFLGAAPPKVTPVPLPKIPGRQPTRASTPKKSSPALGSTTSAPSAQPPRPMQLPPQQSSPTSTVPTSTPVEAPQVATAGKISSGKSDAQASPTKAMMPPQQPSRSLVRNPPPHIQTQFPAYAPPAATRTPSQSSTPARTPTRTPTYTPTRTPTQTIEYQFSPQPAPQMRPRAQTQPTRPQPQEIPTHVMVPPYPYNMPDSKPKRRPAPDVSVIDPCLMAGEPAVEALSPVLAEIPVDPSSFIKDMMQNLRRASQRMP